MSHVVAVRLPDGRHAVADYTDPIVKAMRRVNRRLGEGTTGADEDYRLIGAWLDRTAPLAGTQLELAGLRPGA